MNYALQPWHATGEAETPLFVTGQSDFLLHECRSAGAHV